MTPRRRRTHERHCGIAGPQWPRSWGRGTARREVLRCRTGSRLLICLHTRSDVLCIVGPLRCRGRSCRIGSEQCAASTRRQACGYRLCRHQCRRRRQPLRRRRRDEATRTKLAGPSLMTRRSMERRVPLARERRPQPRHKTGATTFPTYQRRGEWRLISRTHCVESSPVTTPTGGAPTRRRSSATGRRTTGPVVLSSTSPTSLCSGKTPLSNTPPNVDEHHW